MAATVSTDFVFSPKVWQDHIAAYFDKKLTLGAFAVMDDTLTRQPGETVNFPYFTAIGAAEEPAEGVDLTVDNMADDSFSATVKEVGKAVGFKDKSLRVSAAAKDRNFDEAQSQIGRVHAEKVDADLISEINTAGNFETGFTAAAEADVCNVQNLFHAKTIAFGDKADQSAVIFMHSLHYLSMVKDTTTGMLKADANDPMYNVPGFMGRLFGAAVVVTDQVPAGPTVGTKKSFECFICKPNAYGICLAEELMFEQDRDILARETIITATQWYAVKAFHAKIDTEDKRICKATFATEVAA